MDDRQFGRTSGSVPMYSLDERDRRWRLACSFMDREGLDALLVFSEHEDGGPAALCFDTWLTNDRPGAIVVFPRVGERSPSPSATASGASDRLLCPDPVRHMSVITAPPEHMTDAVVACAVGSNVQPEPVP
jgi:hypothetical protein